MKDIAYDKDAHHCQSQGTIHADIIRLIKKAIHFFSVAFPKTIGPELFNLEYIDMKLN